MGVVDFERAGIAECVSTSLTLDLGRVAGLNLPPGIDGETRLSRITTQMGGGLFIASKVSPAIARGFSGVDQRVRDEADRMFFDLAAFLADTEPTDVAQRSVLRGMVGKSDYWNGTTVCLKPIGNNAIRLYASLLSPERTGLGRELLIRTGLCTKNSQQKCLRALGFSTFKGGSK